MSTEHTTKRAEQADTNTSRSAAEEWVERVGAYWGRACVNAWRTVFPPREDNR